MSHLFRRFLLSFIAAATLLSIPTVGQQSTPQQRPDQNQPQGEGQKRGPWAHRGGQRQNHMTMLARKLNLTDQQKQQFQQINQNMRKQVMAVHNDASLSDDQKREKMQDLRKQAHKQMYDVLTPAQRDQLKQMREQYQKDQGKGSGGQAAGKKPGKPADSDDPFAVMTSDDDDEGPGSGN